MENKKTAQEHLAEMRQAADELGKQCKIIHIKSALIRNMMDNKEFTPTEEESIEAIKIGLDINAYVNSLIED